MTRFITNKHISTSLSWQSHARTDTGKVRKINEDNMAVVDKQAHWAVADGMGGHNKGDVASDAVCKALFTLEQQGSLGDFFDNIEDTLIDVNDDLMEQAESNDEVMGTTVAGLVLRDNTALIYWLGDSRIYRLRNGHFEQLSVDHTIVNELVRTKKIRKQEAHSHPEKNVITRAVGAENNLVLYSKIYSVEDGDLFFVCSDGVEKELTDDEVCSLLTRYDYELGYAADSILTQVIERGARDNVTFIIVAVRISNNRR